MNEILLNDILKIPENEIDNYKVRFMINNGYIEPLTIMIQNPKELLDWIAWKSDKDDLSRKKVITFVRYYTKSQDQWIFTGIYKVNKKDNFDKIKNGVGYDIVPIKEYQKLYGKLIVKYKNDTQQLKRNAEKVLNDIEIVEILNEQYSG